MAWGRSEGVTAACRTITSTLPGLVAASASIGARRPERRREEDQQAPLRSGMLNGGAHQCMNQLLLFDFTGYCLRNADDSRQVKLRDGGENRARIG